MRGATTKAAKSHRAAWLWWVRWFSIGCLLAYLLTLLTVWGLIVWLGKDLPDLHSLSSRRSSQATYLYSSDGVTLGVIMSVYRKWVPLRQIPKPLQWATIVAEDRQFYSHPGIDPKGILRALWECIKARRYVQGGSTITMQLARNLYLSSEKTIRRKLKELLLAVQLERRFSKDELLELYLNTVCYGHGAYGVQAAAELYFGKDVRQLSLPQCALLAALPKRPADLSPFVNPKAAKARRDYILEAMAEGGYISPAEAERAKRVPVTEGLRPAPTWPTPPPKAFHFLEFVRRTLTRQFGSEVVERGGLKVYTTLNYRLQQEAEKIAERYLRAYRPLGIDQLAFVLIHIPTGRVIAMYGGRPYRVDPQTGRRVLDHFNRATQAFRQPGSSFKPYVYAAALEMGFRPESLFNDSPISFPVSNGKRWAPKNYDGRYGRTMTLRKALATSNNVIAVKLIRAVGVDRTIEVARRMGIRFPTDPHRASYALALGAIGVTVLDHTAALASVARGGMWVEPIAVEKVYDGGGTLLFTARPITRQVLAPPIARQLLTMLMAVVTEGTGRRAQIPGYQVAGKTGTSEQIKDVWFVGFTPTIACGVWAGNDRNKPLRTGSGGTLCAPIFRDLVMAALRHYPGERTFQWAAHLNGGEGETHAERESDRQADHQPALVQVTVCTETGLLATEYCPITRPEQLPASEAPKRRCPLHTEPLHPTLICSMSGKLATPACPPQAVVIRALPPSEVPHEACDLHTNAPTDRR